jgi:Plant protein of unknown function (DUF946).
MGNSSFIGALLVSAIVLAAALVYAVVSVDADISAVEGNDFGAEGSNKDTLSGGASLAVNMTSNLVFVTDDHGSHAYMDMTIYRPVVESGWYFVGDLAEPSYREPTHQAMLVKAVNDDPTNPALAAPIDWKPVYFDRGSTAYKDTSFWAPVPPDGYFALGCVAVQGYSKPNLPNFMCVRKDLCTAGLESNILWNDRGTSSRTDVTLWGIKPANDNGVDASTFWARPDYNSNPTDHVVCLDKTDLA